MGFLRLYLALCVVFAHSGTTFPWAIHNGREAVQIFYLISGFYMSHIATKYNSVIEFYSSRFIRIYVPYYFILFTVLMLSFGSGFLGGFWAELEPFISQREHNGFAGFAVSSIANLTLYFQDWIMFLKQDQGQSLSFATDLYGSQFPLYSYLMIPQAWTIGVELTFYLFVPFFARQKTKTLFSILLFSLLARIYSYQYLNLGNDPWNYRFFPFELALFLLGMLSNRFYSHIKGSKLVVSLPVIKGTSEYIIGAFLVYLLAYASKKGCVFLTGYVGVNYAELISYLPWAVFIPVLFLIFNRVDVDRWVGDLSYPVYLWHLIVIVYAKQFMEILHTGVGYLGLVSSLITILLAILLQKWVIAPVDRNRYRIATTIANLVVNRRRSVPEAG